MSWNRTSINSISKILLFCPMFNWYQYRPSIYAGVPYHDIGNIGFIELILILCIKYLIIQRDTCDLYQYQPILKTLVSRFSSCKSFCILSMLKLNGSYCRCLPLSLRNNVGNGACIIFKSCSSQLCFSLYQV